MPWSAEFRAALRASSVSPILVLRNMQVTDLDDGWELSSENLGNRGTTYDGVITEEGTSFSGAELTLQTWATTIGTFSVGFTGVASALIRRIARGQWVEMLVGFAGWERGQYQRVALGTVWNVRGANGAWTIECRDVLAGLMVRNTLTAGEQALFTTVSASTDTTAAYTAGVDTVVTVTSTTGFQKQDDGSGTLKGAIRLTSGSTTFILTYTGTTGTTFTGCDTTAVLGTTAVNLSSGATVTEVAFVDDHPIDAARRFLCPDGAYGGTSTVQLPDRWTLQLPDTLIDHVDCDVFKAYSLSSGVNDWLFYAEEEQADCLGWLQGQLAPGGFFFTLYQGSLTVRCVRDPEDAAHAMSVDDLDIIECDEFEAYDASISVEYEKHKTTAGDGTGSTLQGGIASLPAEELYETVVPIYSNVTNQRGAASTRIRRWYTRVPERIRLQCAMTVALLAPGDVVLLTTSRVIGRLATTADGYVARRAMVIGVQPDWFAWACSLTLSVLPDSEDPLY